MHGHSYRVAVHVAGDVDETTGWVIDFADIRRVVQPVLDVVDHSYLNEIKGLENPTSEVLAAWIWEQLDIVLPGLSEVVVRETATSGCVYGGPDRSPPRNDPETWLRQDVGVTPAAHGSADHEPSVRQRYARAAAATLGLPIDETWWPAVLRHLDTLLDRADSLEGIELPDDPAPVFLA